MEKIAIKNKHMFKSRTQMFIYIILFIIMIGLFIYLGNIDYTKEVLDHEKFANDYKIVSVDNVFKYTNHSEVYNIVNGKNGIVLFGHKSSKWLPVYAKIVNDVAMEVGIDEILYYDFLEDREQNNGTYEAIVNKLSNYVTYDDLGNAELYAPSLVVVKDREIIYYDDETAFVQGTVEPDIYWNDFNTNLKINELRNVFLKYLESVSSNGKN